MNTKYNIEELKYNLPDYISNSISDKELISAIETELRTNSELRGDLEELKSTLGFLETSKFEAPPNNYFVNLPVKINERIQVIEAGGSFLERLSLFWKILTPAIPVIILIGILLFNNSKNDTDKIQTNTDLNKIELQKEKTEPIETKNNGLKELQVKDSKNKTPSKEIVKQDNDILKATRKIQNNTLNENQNYIKDQNYIKEFETVEIPEIREQLSELLAGNIEIIEDSNTDEGVDVMFSGETDEESENESLDDEFLNLNLEQQKEIIDNLLKAQI